jgi:hypothetical protein
MSDIGRVADGQLAPKAVRQLGPFAARPLSLELTAKADIPCVVAKRLDLAVS